jgi:hypothetical protein
MAWYIAPLILGSLIALVFIIWLLVPYVIRWKVIPAFNGQYNPHKDPLPVRTEFPIQQNVPALRVNPKTGEYQIDFGDDRRFTHGEIKICYQEKWYTNTRDERASLSINQEDQTLKRSPAHRLELIAYEKKENLQQYSTWGTATAHICRWRIPGTGIEFETTFAEFAKHNYLVCEFKALTEISGTVTGDFNRPGVCFPAFVNESVNQRIFTYRNNVFCPPANDFIFAMAPVLLFDDAKNAVLISPLDNFLTNGIRKEMEAQQNYTVPPPMIACGPNGFIPAIPAGHHHAFIMVWDKGINQTFLSWGKLMQQYYRAQPRDRYTDLVCGYLSFFTDNGAYYYYNPMKGKKADATLIAVHEYAKREHIPFRTYQLDSWWYNKISKPWKRKLLGAFHAHLGGGLYGGAINWEQDPEFWDMSLDEFYHKLDQTPFVAHHRWYVEETPYADRFEFIKANGKAMSVDPAYWSYLMDFCEKNHIVTYEQDWMISHYNSFPHLKREFGAAERWLREMATAAAQRNITIQYCMATPAMILQTLTFPNVSHYRASNDYHARWPHAFDIPYFTQSSMLGWALGIIPFKDVFQSTRRGRIRGERCPFLQGLVSCLSTGPVAPGDEIGFVNKEMVKAVCRSDGLLLKPDRPLTAADLVYIRNHTYYVATTESTHGNRTWYYTITINLFPSRVKEKNYFLHEIDITGEYAEYNWFDRTWRWVTGDSLVSQDLKDEEYEYRIYAPKLASGIALIGNPTKYATMNDKTFSNFKEDVSGVQIDVSSIANDRVDILLIGAILPTRVLVNGNIIADCGVGSYEIQSNQGKIILNYPTDGTYTVTLRA